MSTATACIMQDKDLKFAVNHAWAKLPAHITWGKTHAMVVDKQDRVFVGHTSCEASESKDTVVVFDKDGNFLFSWGPQFVDHLHGLTLHEENGTEYLYVVDDEKGVFKCTLEGDVLIQWGKPELYTQNDWRYGPANVVVMDNGDIYLAEGYGEAYVLHYNAKGELLHHFGGRDEGPEGTNWAHGIYLDEYQGEQLLYITCDAPSEIKRFTLDGKYHSTLNVTLQHPRGIYGNGKQWLIPEMQCRLTIVDPKTEEAYRLGDWGKTMPEVGELRAGPLDTMPQGSFCSAHGAAHLSDGTILISEWIEVGRVSSLTPIV